MGMIETDLKDYIIKFEEISHMIAVAQADPNIPEQLRKLLIKQHTSKLGGIATKVKQTIDTPITKMTYHIKGDGSTYYRLLPVGKEVADLLIPILEKSLNMVVIETKEVEVIGLDKTIYPK